MKRASSMTTDHPRRRAVLLAAASALTATTRAATAATPAASPTAATPAGGASAAPLLQRRIPATGESIPAVGLGTWITFNAGRDAVLRAGAVAVMRAFFDGGGRVVDSSPMYGSAQEIVGHGLAALARGSTVFAAEKVWTGSGSAGPAQIETTRRFWGLPKLDLIQIHNLLAWEAHLPTLQAMKADGRLRLIGITTSHGRRHAELARILQTQRIDSVQLTYNLLDREAEQRLLPLAQERGIAVIVNRPFQEGALLGALARHPLPPFVAELGCDGWAQLALKFVLSHPAVTCVIPATTQVAHVRQNLAAAAGPLPDAALRQRIAAHVAAL